MRLIRFTALISAFAVTINVAAAAREDYDLEHEIPKVTIVGPSSPAFEAIAERMRARLIKQLGYWQDHGLPNPPDLEGIFIFSDPKDLSVPEILRVLNPQKPGEVSLESHARAQREALEKSQFFAKLNAIRKKSFSSSASRSDMLNFLFDFYCFSRYGFAVKNTFEAIEKNLKFSETKPFAMSPQRDNAFYGKFMRVDLSEILKPGPADGKKGLDALVKSVDTDRLTELLRDRDATRAVLSRRIVILPRSTEGQEPNDLTQISSLADPTIDTHELGHHINSSLALHNGSLNRMFEEIWADWSTAAVHDEPVIGRAFAEASGRIAERLAKRDDLTVNELKLKAAFQKLGEKGYIRRMNEPITIESVDRHYVMSGAYDGGNPARAFLWAMRERLNEAERRQFDEVTIETIREAGHLPKVIASKNALKIWMRSIFLGLAQHGRVTKQKKKLLASGDPRYREIMDKGQELLLNDADELAKLKVLKKEKSAKEYEAEAKKRLVRKASEVVLADGLNLQVEAEKLATAQAREKEKKFTSAPGFLWLELKPRPSVTADYVLPEFFRAYYRVAQALAPNLVPAMLEEAARVMRATPVPVPVNDGTTELVFVRRRFGPHWLLARDDVRGYLQTMRDLRPKITELKMARDQAVVKEEVKKLEKEYDRALEHLQQFERTGSYLRMKYPSPVLGFGHRVFKKLQTLSEAKAAAKNACDARLTDL